MRDIKFRAWDKWKKKMIQPNDGDFIGWHAMSNWKHCLDVMQFTGVKDKNGNDIYEGDILKSSEEDFYINGFISPVEFYAGSFHVTIAYDLHMIPLQNYETVWMANGCKGNEETSLWLNEFEVIGNIHENPELI